MIIWPTVGLLSKIKRLRWYPCRDKSAACGSALSSVASFQGSITSRYSRLPGHTMTFHRLIGVALLMFRYKYSRSNNSSVSIICPNKCLNDTLPTIVYLCTCGCPPKYPNLPSPFKILYDTAPLPPPIYYAFISAFGAAAIVASSHLFA